ncbi:DUF3108 domain-containing protein [Anaeromyxobacter sp. Red801]|uniref:DUF3108 domain-containing protein n=1 Tax=Anaeromyxobacter sp. Red801 TaxID=3411632 RepID=UPI003B9DCCA7
MTPAALLALALLAPSATPAAPACGPPPLAAGARPWGPGETLTFDLDLLGMVRTGTLQLSVERPMSGGRVVPLRARARTDASLAALKNVTAVGFSWVDADTLLPERYRDEALENGVRKVSDTRLAPPAGEVVVAYRYGDREGKTAYPRQGHVLDPLSAVYLLRAARLAPGEAFCFDLVANRRFWRLEGTVARKIEPVDTPAGRFQTLRVDAVARRADDPGARARPLHLWFSNDGRRLLVAAVSEIDLGPVRAMLASVHGARAP